MLISQAIDAVDALKPNSYGREEKVGWLSDVDMQIYREKEVSGDEGRRLDVTTSTAKYFFTSRKAISFEKKSSD